MRLLVLAVASLLLAGPALSAEESPPSPTEAWVAMQKEIAEALSRRDRAAARDVEAKRTAEFLSAWEKSGTKAAGQELLFLGRFYGVARRPLEALDAFRACAADETLSADVRGQARGSFGRTTLAVITTQKVSGDSVPGLVAEVTAMLGELRGQEVRRYRADMHRSLALILQPVPE